MAATIIPDSPAMSQVGFRKRVDDKFIIAERYAGNPWPNEGPEADAIATARKGYEAGEVELAQRREGRMEYQYAIPRKKPGTKRPGYFETKQ
mgnify:FL=1